MRMWYKKLWILTERALWSKELKVNISLDFALPAESDLSKGIIKLIFRELTTEKAHPLKGNRGVTLSSAGRDGVQELVIKLKSCLLSGRGGKKQCVNTILITAFIGQFSLTNKIVVTDALHQGELNSWDTHCLHCQHCKLPQNSFIFNLCLLYLRPSQVWRPPFLYTFTHGNISLWVHF